MKEIKYSQFTFLAILIFFSSSCTKSEKNKVLTVVNEDSSYQKGEVFKDSIFNGIVKYYDKEDKNTGYATFKYGIKTGPGVLYSKLGVISDSLNYVNGLENGFGFKYDSSGKLLFKSFYFQGLSVGHVISYDGAGKIKEYYFNSFERKLLYSVKQLSDSLFEEQAEEINATTYRRYDQKEDKLMLFLYILNPPYHQNHYEIAIFDKNKKVISSKEIVTNECFYEQQLEELPNENTYGVILHKFNSYKHKDDLIIKLIQ